MSFLVANKSLLTMLTVLLLASSGCAPTRGGSREAPLWPYAGVAELPRVPPQLLGRSIFPGRWIEVAPDGQTLLTDSVEPRYVIRFPSNEPGDFRLVDLGPGAEVETVGFLDDLRSVLVVGAVLSPHHGRAVVARSLLEIDMDQGQLLDSVPLPRNGIARGLAVDERQRRAYLLFDRGLGEGSVQAIDLYSGRTVLDMPTGTVPAGLSRKGLVLGRNERTLFCLAGGATARSDFAPVDVEALEQSPELLVVSADSLQVTGRVRLKEDLPPRVVAYDNLRDRVYILQSERRGSRITVVDAAFLTIRNEIELPDATTDFVISGNLAFAPGAYGMYLIDLDLEAWSTLPNLPFEFTREMAVVDGRTGYVLFRGTRTGGSPGIATVALESGGILEILR